MRAFQLLKIPYHNMGMIRAMTTIAATPDDIRIYITMSKDRLPEDIGSRKLGTRDMTPCSVSTVATNCAFTCERQSIPARSRLVLNRVV